MTKARHPVTVQDALTRIAGRLTWAGVGDVIGVGERQARNYGDPDESFGANLTLATALKLDAAYLAAGGGEPPIRAYYEMALDRAVQSPADAMELARASARLAKGAGHALAALAIASQPTANARDLAAAERDLLELDETAHDVISRLGGAHQPRPPPDG